MMWNIVYPLQLREELRVQHLVDAAARLIGRALALVWDHEAQIQP